MDSIEIYVNNHGPIRVGHRTSAPIIEDIQNILQAQGAQLIADGEYGEITKAAVRRFQAVHGLTTDGIVGPKTAHALDTEAKTPYRPQPEDRLASTKIVAPWLSVMRAITGTKEIPGARNNPLILAWVDEIVAKYPSLKGTVGWYSNDATPWCGLCVGYCMAHAGFKPPKLLLGAKNWFNDWQDGVQLAGPALGAVMVKSRAGGGHVTLYEGEDEHYYFCRGGNQSDQVNVARIRKDAGWLGFMWPKEAPKPMIAKITTTFANAREGTEF